MRHSFLLSYFDLDISAQLKPSTLEHSQPFSTSNIQFASSKILFYISFTSLQNNSSQLSFLYSSIFIDIVILLSIKAYFNSSKQKVQFSAKLVIISLTVKQITIKINQSEMILDVFTCQYQQNLSTTQIFYYTLIFFIQLQYNFMSKIISVVFVLHLINVLYAQSCPNPTAIVPYAFLDDIFDKVFPTVTGQNDLRTFFTNPSMDTARTYLTSQSSYLITLWIFSGLSLVLFFVCIIQKCCFNCCGSKKCGNKINFNTYSPTSVTCCVYLFMFMSFLLLGVVITSFIITSDLIANLNDTTCDINTTFNYIFDGTPEGYTPTWSGADKFNAYAQNLSINFPNTIPILNDIFQSTQYQLVTDTNGTLYNSAISYSCPSNLATISVGCPFSDISLCVNGSSTQIPIFSQNFCNANITTSSVSLIQNQQNSTSLWRNSLVSLQQSINSSMTNPVSFSTLASETSSLSSSFQSFKPTLSSAINTVNNSFSQTKLGSYIFYSSIIFIALMSFLSACCVFCTRNFNCIKIIYILWVLFAFLAFIFFLASSVLLFFSFTTFGTCVSYDYYTTTNNAFQSFSSYNSSKALQILNTCFNNNSSTNIFDAFSQTNLPTIQQMSSLYYASLPFSNFSTIVTNITNTLSNYMLNPNTANLVGASTSQNPQAALNAINQFADTSSFCGAIGSSFQYNPINCYPLLTNQASSQNPTCVLLISNNQALINNTINCASSNFQSLLNFGDNVRGLALTYTSSIDLQNYRNAYFNYYQAVTTLLNQNVQLLFQSFIQPYQKLIDGSSCSFLTQSLNSLVINSCNRDFPQMYAISLLITAMAACFFLMMIISYFLTTRMEFYAFLNGDLTNYDEDAVDQEPVVTIQMADTTTMKTNRKELLTQPPSPNRTPRK